MTAFDWGAYRFPFVSRWLRESGPAYEERELTAPIDPSLRLSLASSLIAKSAMPGDVLTLKVRVR